MGSTSDINLHCFLTTRGFKLVPSEAAKIWKLWIWLNDELLKIEGDIKASIALYLHRSCTRIDMLI